MHIDSFQVEYNDLQATMQASNAIYYGLEYNVHLTILSPMFSMSVSSHTCSLVHHKQCSSFIDWSSHLYKHVVWTDLSTSNELVLIYPFQCCNSILLNVQQFMCPSYVKELFKLYKHVQFRDKFMIKLLTWLMEPNAQYYQNVNPKPIARSCRLLLSQQELPCVIVLVVGTS